MMIGGKAADMIEQGVVKNLVTKIHAAQT